MADLIREAPLGQLVRYLTNNKYLLYPEEMPDFVCPCSYDGKSTNEVSAGSDTETASPPSGREDVSSLEKPPTHAGDGTSGDLENLGVQNTLEHATSMEDLERALSTQILERPSSKHITPKKLDDGTILVDWYSGDDPGNPQNWSLAKKVYASLQLW